MGIEKAWSVTKGKGVVVGLLDTGVDPTHPDLQNALTPGEDISGKGAANGEKPVDGNPHGTNMAGYIVGRGHGGQGMLGAAPEAKVMSVSYDPTAVGVSLSKGLRYLVDHGAKVINMSFTGDSPATADIAYAEAHDVVLVAGTGNGMGTPPENPSSQFGVVSVSGVLKGLTKIASGASYGPPEIDKGATTTTGFPQGTALAGPYSTTNGNDDLVSLTTTADGSYAMTSGTSNATAIVSGIVALIRAAHPDLDAANVINRLVQTASIYKQGKISEQIGFGVPDAYAAVTTTSVKSTCANPLGSQVTKSLGFWPSVLDPSFVYKPQCSTNGSSSSPGTASSSASSPASSAASAPATSAPSQAASSGGSSGGVPAWVYILIAVAVLAAIGLVVVLRGRGKRGGPGGPPNGPPSGGYGPPAGGPYGGPPQGGWQQGPPQQGGWQPGS